MRFLVVEDHPMMLESFRAMFRQSFHDATVVEATSFKEALPHCKGGQFDLVLLDVELPDGSGLDLIKPLKESANKPHVLVMSGLSEEEAGWQAIQAGAAGFLPKTCGAEKLEAAIRQILSGHKFVTEKLAEQLVDELQHGHTSPSHTSLSERELEVLRLLGGGAGISEIADKLSLSVKTVSTYRTRMLEKLNLKTTAELIRYAIKSHLVD